MPAVPFRETSPIPSSTTASASSSTSTKPAQPINDEEVFAFQRAVSRLTEMQSANWLGPDLVAIVKDVEGVEEGPGGSKGVGTESGQGEGKKVLEAGV